MRNNNARSRPVLLQKSPTNFATGVGGASNVGRLAVWRTRMPALASTLSLSADGVMCIMVSRVEASCGVMRPLSTSSVKWAITSGRHQSHLVRDQEANATGTYRLLLLSRCCSQCGMFLSVTSLHSLRKLKHDAHA